MPSSANVNARIIARIENAGHTLTIVYPATRPVATGVSPGVGPVSPLTGPAAVDAVFEPDPTPYQPDVTVQCLWTDMATGSQMTDNPSVDKFRYNQLGWVRDASALARVLISETALDPTNPYAGTKFDAADHIVYQNRRYRVLQVNPIEASFGTPVSYYVWVTGNQS